VSSAARTTDTAQFHTDKIAWHELCAQIFRNIFRERSRNVVRDSHAVFAPRTASDCSLAFFLTSHKMPVFCGVLRDLFMGGTKGPDGSR
jgi:hypothetical protein